MGYASDLAKLVCQKRGIQKQMKNNFSEENEEGRRKMRSKRMERYYDSEVQWRNVLQEA